VICWSTEERSFWKSEIYIASLIWLKG